MVGVDPQFRSSFVPKVEIVQLVPIWEVGVLGEPDSLTINGGSLFFLVAVNDDVVQRPTGNAEVLLIGIVVRFFSRTSIGANQIRAQFDGPANDILRNL
ncbi:hypothetical protein BN996_01107 [Haloferax massiliensis]|uniref:Uncharacterized protein n=1 Tax=Haloferax massiliensis TaxID=1476858 RepID=A0A0D6JPX5_9EURY|nr:hypothetical protein BN996_01107 [Haloferax massiliensis]